MHATNLLFVALACFSLGCSARTVIFAATEYLSSTSSDQPWLVAIDPYTGVVDNVTEVSITPFSGWDTEDISCLDEKQSMYYYALNDEDSSIYAINTTTGKVITVELLGSHGISPSRPRLVLCSSSPPACC